jgi:hypothetical protein
VSVGATNATNFTDGFEPASALGPDRLAAAGEEVGRRDVADRAVQANGVVVLDESGDEGASLFGRARLARTNRPP